MTVGNVVWASPLAAAAVDKAGLSMMVINSLMKLSLFCAAAACFSTAVVSIASTEPEFGTFKVDVVALLQLSKEVTGSPDSPAERLGYRYLFSSIANRDIFLKDPEKYEVQLGGACGKMGELSGRGNPDRFLVHGGRLYIFASDGCRNAFQQDPKRHLDRDDLEPRGSTEVKEKGRELLERAGAWSGVDKLGADGLMTFYESTYEQDGQKFPMVLAATVWASGDYLWKDTYSGRGYANEIAGSQVREIDPDGKVREHVPTWRRAVERARDRNLAWVLLARRHPSSSAEFRSTENGIAEVMTFTDGTVSTLWIQAATGKIVAFETTGRGGGGPLGKVKRVFTAYETVKGITFPVAWTATFEGNPSKGHSRDRVRLRLVEGRELAASKAATPTNAGRSGAPTK